MDNKELDLVEIINNMSSINSEDYWFKKLSQFEEHDEIVETKEIEKF